MPFVRGFNCDDETIRYPYKDSTVSSGVCYFVGSGINIFLILVLEYLNLTVKQDPSSDQQQHVSREAQIDQFNVKIYARNVYCRLLIWFFGAITSELLTDVSKVTAGRLRPHFIDVCKPFVNGIPVDQYCGTSTKAYEYITDYTCTGSPKSQRDARLSFLSGHSSYSAYSATFAVFYIQDAVDIYKFGLLKPASQVLITSMAFYTGLTRVSDYKHHWQDVLAGFLLGTVVASIVSTFVWPSFYKTYAKYWNKFITNKLTDPNDAPAAELNRLGY